MRKLWGLFSRRDRLIFAGLVAMMLIGAALETVGIGAIPAFVMAATRPEALLSLPLGQKLLVPIGLTSPKRLIIAGALVLIVVFVLKNAYLTFAYYVQLRVVKNRQVALAKRLFDLYMHAPLEFHLEHNSAELLRNVRMEVEMVCNGILLPILQTILSSVMAVLLMAVLVTVEPMATLLTLLVLGVAGGGAVWRVTGRIKAYGEEAQHYRRGIMQTVQQALGSIKEAKLSHREPFFVSEFEYGARRTAIAQRFTMLAGAFNMHYLEAVAVTLMLSLAIFLVGTGRDPATIAPTLALFAAALVRLKSAVGKLMSSATQISYQAAAVHTVHDDIMALAAYSCAARQPDARPMPFSRQIELRNVAYRYPNTDTPALNDISLTIPKGSSVGFVGTTGAGKTTLVDVLLGLLPATDGSVTVDGADICEDMAGWHANIGYVPQSIYLTDDTIRHNVALGIEDRAISEGRLAEAVRAAQLSDFIETLPQGLDTVVGEAGVRLSGGQRQRIGLARALYRNPDVLVLDEGTSALDNETEKAVMAALASLKGKRTIIMIAHRLSTVEPCDRLYLMQDGQISAQGSYSELVTSQPKFRTMAGVVSEGVPE